MKLCGSCVFQFALWILDNHKYEIIVYLTISVGELSRLGRVGGPTSNCASMFILVPVPCCSSHVPHVCYGVPVHLVHALLLPSWCPSAVSHVTLTYRFTLTVCRPCTYASRFPPWTLNVARSIVVACPLPVGGFQLVFLVAHWY